jgi:hypothetical protein
MHKRAFRHPYLRNPWNLATGFILCVASMKDRRSLPDKPREDIWSIRVLIPLCHEKRSQDKVGACSHSEYWSPSNHLASPKEHVFPDLYSDLFNRKFQIHHDASGLYRTLIGNPLGVNLSKFLSTCTTTIANNIHKNPPHRMPIQTGEYVMGAACGSALCI